MDISAILTWLSIGILTVLGVLIALAIRIRSTQMM